MPPDPASVQPGTLIAGQFKILQPLSQGGMGSVYIAEQLGTGHHRAVKLMHPSLAQDPRARERFAQEAQSTARIESEHVAQVIAAGIDPAINTPWIAMELLRGKDLSAMLSARTRLPLDEVRLILRQLGHALSAAHRVGIVHRDLKPDNVFIADAHRSDAAFTVKVLDFGIAKWLLDHQPARATAIVGSPLWMAPEQFDTSNALIAPGTDLWPLGLLAFTALTGKHFWRSVQGDGLNVAALIAEITAPTLPSASQRAAEMNVGNCLPPGFDNWFARCTASNPQARFSTATEAVSAFESVVSHNSAQGVAPTVAFAAQPAAQAFNAPFTPSSPNAFGAVTPMGAPQGVAGTVAVPLMTPGGVPVQSTAAAGTMAWQPGMANPYGSQPGMANPYGSQPGMANPYGSQPGMANPYGSQPGMANPYGSQPGFGPSPSGDARVWGMPPSGPYTSTAGTSGAQKRGAGPAVLALGVAALLAAGGVGAWIVSRTQCVDGEHRTNGHCCLNTHEWNTTNDRCEPTTGSTQMPSTLTSLPPAQPPAITDAGAITAVSPDSGSVAVATTESPVAPIAPREPEPQRRRAPPAERSLCLGRWSGALSENTGSRGFMTGVVTGTRGTCGSWQETWSSGARCHYRLTACVSTGTMLRAVGRTSSGRCGDPVYVTMRCDRSAAIFRETARGSVVDTGRLTRL